MKKILEAENILDCEIRDGIFYENKIYISPKELLKLYSKYDTLSEDVKTASLTALSRNKIEIYYNDKLDNTIELVMRKKDNAVGFYDYKNKKFYETIFKADEFYKIIQKYNYTLTPAKITINKKMKDKKNEKTINIDTKI